MSLRDLHRHQGKTNPCHAARKASHHFLVDGAYTRFKNWRFVHRARLGLVKFNGLTSSHKSGPGDRRCRHCGNDETLPHILNHYMVRCIPYRKRHDVVVD